MILYRHERIAELRKMVLRYQKSIAARETAIRTGVGVKGRPVSSETLATYSAGIRQFMRMIAAAEKKILDLRRMPGIINDRPTSAEHQD